MITFRIIFICLLCILVGMVIGFIASNNNDRKRIFAFGALGFLIGIVIGLSKSPVIAAAIAGTLSLISTIAPKLIDKAENVIKIETWLAPLAILTVVGLSCGITIRTNDLLTFHSTNYEEMYIQQGFTKKQVGLIMDRLSKKIVPSIPEGKGSSLLTENKNILWSSFWDMPITPEKKIEQIQQLGSPFEKKIIKMMQDAGVNDQKIVDGIKRIIN